MTATTVRGRTALVTGAAGGIGAFIARTLARHGANVVLTGRNHTALQALQSELRSSGVTVDVLVADLSSPDDLDTLIARAEEATSGIDILINNAGVELISSYEAMTPAEIDFILDVNLRAPMQLMRQVLPLMRARGYGHVVNVGSAGGYLGIALMGPYSASKAGMHRITQSLRAEYLGTGVSLSFVAPGLTEAGMIAPFREAGVRVPRHHRISDPQDVADAVLSAIEAQRAEQIVDKSPLRALFTCFMAAPRLSEVLMRKFASDDMTSKVAAARGRLVEMSAPDRHSRP